MTMEEFERYLILHAKELGITAVGRNKEGLMVFKLYRDDREK